MTAPVGDVAFATSRVLRIAAALSQPATLAAFDALAAVPLPDGATYDAGAVRLLPTIASALWYARTRYLTASAQSTAVAPASSPPATTGSLDDDATP